ncbi:hypothetical protein FKP32DRAFT_1679439 [Trametes sanguinea]|nr:hypothetical protein FKP32DRAFT_1679439 [Trametes sanguinea]
MQVQDDPFRIGGSINPAKLSGGVIIANLATGYSCMSFLSAFHWDWSLVKGRVGCRPGAFMVYFGCRYLAILSMVSTIAYLNAFAVTSLYPLRYLAQLTGGIALGLAYSVLLIRIAAIFENIWLSAFLDVLKLVFWAIIWKSTTEVPGEHRHLRTELAMEVYTLVVSALAFFTILYHALHLCKRERHPTVMIRVRILWREDVCEYALICATAIASAIVTFLDHDPSGFSNFATAYMKFTIR